MDYRQEKLKDKILEKFRGDEFFDLNIKGAQEKLYLSIDKSYYEVENNVHFLISDGSLELIKGVLKLSRKGFYIISNLRVLGYEAKAKKEYREKLTHYLIQGATLLIATISLWVSIASLNRQNVNSSNRHNHCKCDYHKRCY